MPTAPKPTAVMRRILADIHNAAGGMLPRSHFTGPGTGAVTALLSRKLLADDRLDPAGAGAMLRLTDAGRAALGLRPDAMSPGLAPSPIVKTDPPKPTTGGLVQSPLRKAPTEAPAREARSNVPAHIEKAAGMTEAAIVLSMAEKIERAVALRDELTAEDWLELYTLAHKARAMVKDLQELRDFRARDAAPRRDDDPTHPQE